MAAPLVSVIIVTWNGLPLLKRCLPSVVATAYEHVEIILADNASTDGTVAWVEERYPSINVVRHPENWAFCKGNNAAMPHAQGKYVVLLNNDVEVRPGWLGPLVALLEREPGAGAVQPKLLQYEDRHRFEYAGASGGFIDRLGYPFTRGRIFFSMEDDRGQYDDARDVFWATGAAIMLRRTALDAAGLLDERFSMHMEEIDLCWRLHRAGYRVLVEPASQVFHIGGGSLPQGDVRKVYLNFRNSLLMLYKNLPAGQWWRLLPQRVAFDALAAGRALVKGRFAEAAAIVRAYADAHRMKKHYADVRPTKSEPAAFPPYRGSIVVDYYLRRRHAFSDLPASRFNARGLP